MEGTDKDEIERLQDLIRAGEAPVPALYQILETALKVLGTTMGNIQILDSREGVLKFAVHIGFNKQFLEHFKSVPIGYSCCGQALKRRERIIVEDAFKDPLFSHMAATYKSYGFVAAQSTPLFNSREDVSGVLTTHFVKPFRPTASQLANIDALARLAAQVIETNATAVE